MNGIVVDLTDDSPVDLSSHGGGTRDDSVPLDLHTSNGSLEKENIDDDPYSHLDMEGCQKAIRSLEEELRNEETRLLLLRKIRLSQATKSKTATVSPTVRSNGHSHGPGIPQQQRYLSGSSRPVPDARLSAGSGSSMQLPMASKSLIRSPPYSTAQRQAGVARPIIASQVQASGRSQREIDMMAQQHTATLQQQKQQLMQRATTDSKRQQELSAQQRQAVAKQALRKQLEQTLLQIPPPKPPPPSIRIIPNGNSLDFLALIGLEECVQLAERNKAAGLSDDSELKGSESKRGAESGETLKNNGEIDEDKLKTEHDDDKTASVVFPDKMNDKKCRKDVTLPSMCSHCHTDFTPVWIKTKDSTGMICERCDSFKRKQALKTEHTNRLKNAFLKALQQEQAIDQGAVAYMGGAEVRSTSSIGGSSGRNMALPVSSGSSGSRAVAMSAEDLARRMIAHRASPTVSSQYRASSNHMSRPSNGVYDKLMSSTNQAPRNITQYDRPANQMSRSGQYDRMPGSPAVRSSTNHVVHIDLTSSGGRRHEGSGQGSSRYKVLPSDEGRYSSSRGGAPYSRT